MIGIYILFIGVAYFLFALFITFWLASRPKKIMHQITIFIVLVLFFVLIPTADNIVGNIYFKSVCNKYSGIIVYKKVSLGDEYYLKSNESDTSKWIFNLNFLTKDGGQKIDREKFRKEYAFKIGMQKKYSKLFTLYKKVDEIEDKKNGEILSKKVSFSYGGGWVENIYKIGGTSKKCPEEKQDIIALAEKTFYKK
jgi:hypothetical protein